MMLKRGDDPRRDNFRMAQGPRHGNPEISRAFWSRYREAWNWNGLKKAEKRILPFARPGWCKPWKVGVNTGERLDVFLPTAPSDKLEG